MKGKRIRIDVVRCNLQDIKDWLELALALQSLMAITIVTCFGAR